MAETTIEWTSTKLPDGTVIPGYTFNPWRGCTKVSEGCKNCYAEKWSGRNPATLGTWGPKGERVIAKENYWKQPLRWNHEAQEARERRRVFCASLADVFEGQETMPAESWGAVQEARRRLFGLIQNTPNLDWLLLTKRPENILPMLQEMPIAISNPGGPSLADCMPFANVWFGTSVEDQKAADTRIPHLLKVPAVVRFLSCEPLLGPLDISRWLCCHRCGRGEVAVQDEMGVWYHPLNSAGLDFPCPTDSRGPAVSNILWVICGGESGPNARPMHPDWARSLRNQCAAAGVPFLFKQWGEWIDGCDWPDYRVGEFKGETREVEQTLTSTRCKVITLCKVGKKAAGRLLDGCLWDEYPQPRAQESESLRAQVRGVDLVPAGMTAEDYLQANRRAAGFEE